uniref:Uncharacterized protein n=1 Tax=Acrobeloides nanus TaxID=290746 RepID=A0A914CYV5_9BILA
MGDDTVLACIGGVNMHNSSSDLEEGIAMVAWNDKTSNYILYEATELINSLGNFSIVNAYSLMMHTILDGEAFPWISQNTISFCSTFGCGGNLTTYKNLDAVHQSAIPRFVKHSIGVAHGITMIVCWWVLIASSILIARFGKKYKYEICGSAIWFQVILLQC